ncbi:SCAN domain-containing protein 3 [Trichonephila clavipes]|nr:SCAN domain-containing protein 3 [Trichonephila clavipes]
MMYASQIHRILPRDRDASRYFIGVFPSDEIPLPKERATLDTKHLDDFLRSRIIERLECGHTQLEVSEELGISQSVISKLWQRFQDDGNIIKEELIAITSLLTTTKGTDICTAVRNSLAEKEIDLKKIVSVTTDGAPNMVGKKKNGFISLFKTDVGHSILECHCIIHQQALCAKSGLTSLDNVITLVTKIVNLISSQALNKRKFDALLDEVNSVYNGLIMYNNVRWLSRGNVLQIAWKKSDCFNKMRAKLNNTHS